MQRLHHGLEDVLAVVEPKRLGNHCKQPKKKKKKEEESDTQLLLSFVTAGPTEPAFGVQAVGKD